MIINGNSLLIFLDGQAIGCTTTCTFNTTNEEIDVTCKDNNGARQVLSGSTQWSMDFSGLWNTDSAFGPDDLLQISKDKIRVGAKMGVDTPGSTYIIGYGRLNTLTIEAGLNAGVTFSGTVSGDGEWDYGTTT